MSIIADRVFEIKKQLEQVGGDIEIVAATKTRTIDEILDIIRNTPISAAGENRVQEFVAKYDDSIQWDFIGQLQTNKVKYIIDKTRLIHSVDRLSLLQTINKEAAKKSKIQDILIETNTGREKEKGGLYLEEVSAFAEKVMEYQNVRLLGLMAVTPLDISATELQRCFDAAYAEYAKLKAAYPSIGLLSMGMSNDYLRAAESGANLVRLGRAIFGERK
jgi:pyridoxal phosphate enzyme (YggS family)